VPPRKLALGRALSGVRNCNIFGHPKARSWIKRWQKSPGPAGPDIPSGDSLTGNWPKLPWLIPEAGCLVAEL